MGFVVLDTDVLSSASPGAHERAQEGWRLLQCLVDECHVLLVSPNLWKEYKQIAAHSMGLRKLAREAFAKIEMDDGLQDVEEQARLEQLGVDKKDIEWVLLAAKYQAVFVTWEKYAPKRPRGKSAEREQRHYQVIREVESEFGVCIWHPDYALRRLCSRSS